MKFKNIILGVIEETENEFVIEQFLRNTDMYEVVDEKTEKEEKIEPAEETEEVEPAEKTEEVEEDEEVETKTPKNKK